MKNLLQSKKLTLSLLFVYLLFLTWIIVFKMEFSLENFPHMRSINLIPFGASVITNDTLDFSEILDNVFAFIPFGIFTGILLKQRSFFWKLLPIFFTSFAYETAQYVLAIGASDVTDLLTNTLGGAVGIAVFLLLYRIFKDKTGKIVNGVCLVGAVLMISLLTLILLANSSF